MAWATDGIVASRGAIMLVTISSLWGLAQLTSCEFVETEFVPPKEHGLTDITRSAILVTNDGAVRAPYSRLVDELYKQVVNVIVWGEGSAGRGDILSSLDEFSVIIPVRDEDKYLAKTIRFTIEHTPPEHLREIIIVDDGSVIPASTLLESELPPKMMAIVKVIRLDTREGLIRARIKGANVASAENIIFLDGHCRPKIGWSDELLAHLKTNYRRIVCPIIEDIDEETWEDKGTSGFKMMFDWIFEFRWYEDLEDEIPISAGGILAITKKWWNESGMYDDGMLEWGGENIEQSIRVWLCGGEIFVARNSFIGHIFNRPPKPNPENRLVKQIQTNQKRAALVWLDEYYELFITHHHVVKEWEEGDVSARKKLRRDLQCLPFSWYVRKFRTSFERKGMLEWEYIHLQHRSTGLCLIAVDVTNKSQEKVGLGECVATSHAQAWQSVAGGRMMYNRQSGKCLAGSSWSGILILKECKWNDVLQLMDGTQFWQFDENKSGRIFSYKSKDIASLTGHDRLLPNTEKAHLPTSKCVTWTEEKQNIVSAPCLPSTTAGSIDHIFDVKWSHPKRFSLNQHALPLAE